MEGDIKFKKLMAMHIQALAQEELFWKEKFKDKIITNNDRNTSYFHITDNLVRLSKFRLISLCNVSYTIFSKILTTRLSELMQDIIGVE